MIFFHKIEQLHLSIEFWIILLDLIIKFALNNEQNQTNTPITTVGSGRYANEISPFLLTGLILSILSQYSSIQRSNNVKALNIIGILIITIVHELINNNWVLYPQNFMPILGMIGLIARMHLNDFPQKKKNDSDGSIIIKSSMKKQNQNNLEINNAEISIEAILDGENKFKHSQSMINKSVSFVDPKSPNLIKCTSDISSKIN